MLILNRYKDESIIIDNNIIIKILDVRGRSVRVGVEAPRYIDIQREEIREKILKKKQMLTN